MDNNEGFADADAVTVGAVVGDGVMNSSKSKNIGGTDASASNSTSFAYDDCNKVIIGRARKIADMFLMLLGVLVSKLLVYVLCLECHG